MAGVGELRGGNARGAAPLSATRSGAVTQDVPFQFDPTINPAYRGAMRGGGFVSVQVISPILAAGPADLDIQADGRLFFLAGGGNSLVIPGPVWGVKATPRGAGISGTGADQITFLPVGRY